MQLGWFASAHLALLYMFEVGFLSKLKTHGPGEDLCPWFLSLDYLATKLAEFADTSRSESFYCKSDFTTGEESLCDEAVKEIRGEQSYSTESNRKME